MASKRLRRSLARLAMLLVATAAYSQNTATSLLQGIRAGEVQAVFSGTGGSSGDSVRVRVAKGRKAAPGGHDYSIPPGTRLTSSDGAAQSMIVLGVSGQSTGELTYTPTSVITVPDRGSAEYILNAYCAEFHKDNPSTDTHFTLEPADAVLRCIARNAQGLPIAAVQAAVWMYTDGVSYSEVNEKFPVTAAEWRTGERVFQRCQASTNPH